MKFIIRTLFFAILSLPLFSEIIFTTQFSENTWTIEITNSSEMLYEAMVISADPHFKPEPGQLIIEPGDQAILKMISEPGTELKDEPVYIRLISDHRSNPGLVTLGDTTEITNSYSIENETDGIVLEYYYTPTCSSCREFLESEIPGIEKKLHTTITIQNIDITTGEGLKQMNQRLSFLGSSEKKLPLLIVSDIVIGGDKEIKKNLEDIILGNYIQEKKLKERDLNLSLLPILLAGLLDGINPCAFSTLIFLLSWLTLAGRNKKEILITGIFFTTSVFITYYTVGLGAFAALRTSETVPLVSVILKYTMATLMLILGIIHIFDYRKVRMGRAEEMTLQLSKERKKKIHSLIRSKARQTGLFAGSIVLGILVTIYELGCTGQVYLPTLMYMVRIEKGLSSYFLLGLYNFGFIIPLVLVFIAARQGLESEKLALWFKNNLAAVKLVSAGFFLLMAILLIIV